MDMFSSVSAVQRKIQDLEEQEKVAVQRLERAEMMKKEGAQYYHGTELPIEDAIFSLKEGQVKSAQIALEFYRTTLNALVPPPVQVAPPEAPQAAVAAVPAVRPPAVQNPQ